MMRIIATVALLSAAFSACCLGGEKASFTVATCNIQMAPTPSANKWEFRKDFQKELLEKYRFDIFGMQETFKHQIDYVLPDGYAYIGCGRDDGAQKGEYSPIAYDKSKFNCLESGVFWLSQTPSKPSFGWDAACRRLCTWGRFRHLKSGKIFYFFNTHLDHKGKLARAEGVKLILKRVGEIAKGGSFIITGDFNARPSDAEIVPMFDPKNAVEASAAESLGAERGTFHAYTGKPLAFIDYIFLSPKISVKKYAMATDKISESRDEKTAKLASAKGGCQYASDHFPVYAEIEF